MATTTLPTVKARIVALLTAEATLTGVQVRYGHPSKDAPREFVSVGGTEENDQEWAALGTLSRGETYSLSLVCSVWQPGADQQTVTERAFVLFAAAETSIRADPTLGLTISGVKALVAEVVPRRLLEQAHDDGRIGEVQAVVSVTARI